MTTVIILGSIVAVLSFFYLMHHKDEAMATHTDRHIPIIVTGHWIEDGEEFKHYCIIGDENTCPDRHSNKVFWYFRDEFQILGWHDEFHISGFEYINEENDNG